jgi:hypothetical protein
VAAQEKYNGVRVVVRLEQYGTRFCFHIDPGDGSTLPIYIPEDSERRLLKKVEKLERGLIDIVVSEEPWEVGDSTGVKRYLKRIKESNARE